jgi:hypothetical protein
MSVSLLVAFLLLEIGVRVFFGEEVDSNSLAEHLASIAPGPVMAPSRNVRKGFELLPSYSGKMGPNILRTDAEGFRIGRKHGVSSPPALRVALLGDSTAFGWNVNYEETYGSFLESELREKTSCPLVLRNFAVFAYNSRMELEVYKEHIADWQPHVLLVHHDFNDAEPTSIPPDYLHVEYGDNVLHSALIKFVCRRVETYRRNRAWKLFKSNPPNKSLWVYAYEGPAWEDHVRALEEIASLCRRQHIIPALFMFDAFVKPAGSEGESDRRRLLYEKTERRLRDAGYYIIDLYPELQQLMQECGWTNLDPMRRSAEDWHPGPDFHRFIAHCLESHLLDSPDVKSLLESCR